MPISFTDCKLCNFVGKSRQSLIRHVRFQHGLSSIEYTYVHENLLHSCKTCHGALTLEQVKQLYVPGTGRVFCSGYCAKLAKIQTAEFYKLNEGLNEEEAKAKVKSETKRRFPEFVMSQKQYYIQRGYSEANAVEQVRRFQSKSSLPFVIAKYGEEEGKRIYLERSKKRSSQYSGIGNPRYGCSLSEDLRNSIALAVKQKLTQLDHRNKIYQKYVKLMSSPLINMLYTSTFEFDVYNRLLAGGIECEQQFPLLIDETFIEQYKKQCNTVLYLYDFKVKNIPIIIEAYGWYTHADPLRFNAEDVLTYFGGSFIAKDRWQQDKLKNKYAIDKGYQVLIIWERDDLTQQLTNTIEVIKNALC